MIAKEHLFQRLFVFIVGKFVIRSTFSSFVTADLLRDLPEYVILFICNAHVQNSLFIFVHNLGDTQYT